MKCHYCKENEATVEHHIHYKPEETVSICKSCHYKITQQMKYARNKNGTFLCFNCGRHYTSNKDKICWKCKHPEQKDWFGLTAKDKTKPIYRYNLVGKGGEKI